MRMHSLSVLLLACSCQSGGKDEALSRDSSASVADDTGALLTWYRDTDNDGYGHPDDVARAADAPPGYVADGSDCDDEAPTVFPGAPELCNDHDDDCDGAIDEELASQWYLDADGDGWGSEAEVLESCLAPTGYAPTGEDCDDANPSVRPDAVEVCGNGLDDDCLGDGDGRCSDEGATSLADAPVKYLGGTAGDLAGYQVECDGDATGDGRLDLLIGESEQFTDDYAGSPSIGGAWLVSDISAGTHDLDDAAVALWGDRDGRFRGGASVFLRDIDRDGFDEILMGSPHAQEAYLFDGPTTGARGRLDAEVAISETTGGLGLGWSAAALGADGFAVAGVGNLYQSGMWGASVGGTFVFDSPFSGGVTTDEAVAFLAPHVSHQYGYFGYATCSGDLNGDGVYDLVVGAPSPYPTRYPDFMAGGVAYVVYGPFSGELRVADTDGALIDADARVEASAGSGVTYLGQAVACAGDADGDGISDLAVTASEGPYLFKGPLHGIREEVDADGIYAGFGVAVSHDVDLDADGLDDVVVGVRGDGERGLVQIFSEGFSGTLTSADAQAAFEGEAEGDSAYAGVGCPDLDGDGLDDLLIGAAGESSSGTWSGAAYVVFGSAL